MPVKEDLMNPVAEGATESPARLALKGKSFRCFAYKNKSGMFVAECIDLNLIVRAKTMKKAVSSLGNAIFGYLSVAAGGDLSGLIPRPSPLSHRIHYHAVGVQIKLARTILSWDSFRLERKLFQSSPHCLVAS
jgi:hypothetical protein